MAYAMSEEKRIHFDPSSDLNMIEEVVSETENRVKKRIKNKECKQDDPKVSDFEQLSTVEKGRSCKVLSAYAFMSSIALSIMVYLLMGS